MNTPPLKLADALTAQKFATASAWLVGLLRLIGLIDLAAVVAVAMPRSWMQWGCMVTGLADFPTEPLAGYLARSASAMYALFGLLLLVLSTDILRYWLIIRTVAGLAMMHGMTMVFVDWLEGMPLWWTLVEGPTTASTGLLIWLVQGWVQPCRPDDRQQGPEPDSHGPELSRPPTARHPS